MPLCADSLIKIRFLNICTGARTRNTLKRPVKSLDICKLQLIGRLFDRKAIFCHHFDTFLYFSVNTAAKLHCLYISHARAATYNISLAENKFH